MSMSTEMVLSGLLSAARDHQRDEIVSVLELQTDESLFSLAVATGELVFDEAIDSSGEDSQCGPIPIFPDDLSEAPSDFQLTVLRTTTWISAIGGGQTKVLAVIWSGMDNENKYDVIMSLLAMIADDMLSDPMSGVLSEGDIYGEFMNHPFSGALVEQFMEEMSDSMGTFDGSESVEEVFGVLFESLEPIQAIIELTEINENLAVEAFRDYVGEGNPLFPLLTVLISHLDFLLSEHDQLEVEAVVFLAPIDDRFLTDVATPFIVNMLVADPSAMAYWSDFDIKTRNAVCEYIIRLICKTGDLKGMK